MKAELWDNMHYLFRDFNDRMVHVELQYDYHIDVEKFKTVLVCFFEKTPVLHSSFRADAFLSFWEQAKYHVDDILTVGTPDDLEAAKEAFLTQYIPPENPIQMKIALFYKDEETHLCLVVNHMCMDGGDLKYFVYCLCKNYTNYVEYGKSPLELRTGDRNFETVYSGFSKEDQKAAKLLYKNVCSKDPHKFPLTEPSEKDASFIVKRKLSPKTFRALRATGKKYGATFNDVLLTAYIDSLYTLLDLPDGEALSVACAMDLRRYKAEAESDGLTNQTAFMNCGVEERGKTIFETLRLVAQSSKSCKEDKFMGLYGLPLLSKCYGLLPHSLSEKVIKTGYRNPYISMSNIGVLDSKKLSLCGCAPKDGYMTGAVKYKPYVLLSATTLGEEVTLSMCVRGNAKDRQIVESFFDLLLESAEKLCA